MSERPDEGMLLAFLDDELDRAARAEVERWVQGDASVAQELDELSAAAKRFGVAAAELDQGQGPISVDLPLALLERVRTDSRSGTSSARRSGRTPGGVRSATWGRAAALILAAGLAGASALPGSPVSGWWRAGWAALQGSDTGETLATTVDTEEAPAGLAVTPDLGRLTVRIEEVRPGTTLIVTFGQSDEAGVYTTGSPSFATGAGFVDVRGPGDRIQVHVPAAVTELQLSVDGVQYLTRSGGDLRTPVEPSERFEGEFVYRIQAQSPN